MASLLLVPALALAAGSTGPGDAAGPDDGWEMLPVGQANWYEFTYLGHYDFEEGKDGEERAIFEGTPVEVWLDAEPDGGAVFRVVTEEEVQAWVAGEDLESCGCGTENEHGPGDLNWAGNFARPGTYYVVVEHRGAEPTQFKLSISGEEIEVPQPATAAPAAEEPAALADGATPEDNSGPSDALAPSGQWTLIPAGGSQWYTFQYTGHHQFEPPKDENEEEKPIWIPSLVEVWMEADPEGSLGFQVLTPENVQAWQAGEELVGCGCGTENEALAQDLTWAGNFGKPGTYYVLVENPASEDAYYQLGISGEDVSY